MPFLIPFILTCAEIVWLISTKYPPTLDQLHLGISSPFILSISRIIGLALVTVSTFFLSVTISSKTRRNYWIIVFACPALSVLWMSYPIDVLRLFLVSATYYLLVTYKKSFAIGTTCAIVVLLILNLSVFKQRPKIIETLSLARSQEEVTKRFTIEDSQKPNIKIPTLVRRIGYNKFFISLKNSANEAITFIDLETIFFQEVHPVGQKALVIFFWPEVFIFILSLWFYITKYNSKQKAFLPLLLLAFIYFLTTSASVDRRLIFLIFPLSLLMSQGIEIGLKNRHKNLRRILIVFIFLSFYGWSTNYFDRLKRPDHWQDNHPIAYNAALSYLKQTDQEYTQIIVSETLYAAKDYCLFYLKKCDKFSINDFDLYTDAPQKNTVYIGYTKNFLGPHMADATVSEIEKIVSGKDMKILGIKHIYDNIASGSGQEIIVAITNK